MVSPLFGSLLLAELLGNKDQIEDVDDAVAVGVGGGFTETVGDLHKVQDVDFPIAVDIGETFGCEVDFAIKIGEEVGGGRSVTAPIGDGGRSFG